MEPQEQTRTCGNCWFSEKAPPAHFMNSSLEFEDVKCSIANHYRSANDTDICDDWKPKE